jgi:hypothetical protein
MEHVRAPSKGLSTKNVFCVGPMVICACGLLVYPAKVPNFNIVHDYALWFRNFMVMVKNPENLDFETCSVGLGQSSSVISLKNTFSKRQFCQNKKLCSLFPCQHRISYLFIFKFTDTTTDQTESMASMLEGVVYIYNAKLFRKRRTTIPAN